jgi:hypothetical protein
MSKKIIGVTVGTPLPKPNFKQTDPTKGDYIKNKPDFEGLKTRVGNVEDAITSVSELVGDVAVATQIADAVAAIPQVVVDPTLTIEGAAADAKVVGDLWRLVADDYDVIWLLAQLGLIQKLADEAGAILTDEVGNILLL